MSRGSGPGRHGSRGVCQPWLPVVSAYAAWHQIWYQFVWNDDVRRLTKQPKLTAIIQSRRFTLFGRIMRMDDNKDAKRILLASPPADWRR